eukprot:TRINITY_DN7384_c0_g1_i1.p1 TRINITY_DN7384_c0_g1~~TRINITY_DN7384_c0_g1_i1.p1  ORF type:complete len:212 (+),score=15.60 TRINITY_DN7384_c0_g1_i1:273-908(+)
MRHVVCSTGGSAAKLFRTLVAGSASKSPLPPWSLRLPSAPSPASSRYALGKALNWDFKVDATGRLRNESSLIPRLAQQVAGTARRSKVQPLPTRPPCAPQRFYSAQVPGQGQGPSQHNTGRMVGNSYILVAAQRRGFFGWLRGAVEAVTAVPVAPLLLGLGGAIPFVALSPPLSPYVTLPVRDLKRLKSRCFWGWAGPFHLWRCRRPLAPM